MDDYYEYDDFLPSKYEDDYYEDEDESFKIQSFEPSVLIEARIESYSFISEVQNIYKSCTKTVLKQSFVQNQRLIISCLLYQIILQILFFLKLKPSIHLKFANLASIILGVFALSGIFYDIFMLTCYIVIGLLIITYFLMVLNVKFYQKVIGNHIAVLTVVAIIISEVVFQDSSTWSRIRGLLLLLAMKIISFAFDIERGTLKLTSFFEFVSFAFHPGTIMFGPWINFKDFQNSIKIKTEITSKWFLSLFKNTFCALICLLISTCVSFNLFIDPLQPLLPSLIPIVSNKWIQAYVTTLSFHFSHYYICYLSVVTSQLTGCCCSLDIKSSKWISFKVVEPFSVEIPTSMLNVVVSWNIQMSKWLKSYVFESYKHLGKFPAILLVYIASSLLHGLSLHLALVIVSLAVYTYVEFKLRFKLSKLFKCPYIQSRPNKNYKLSEVPFYAHFINFIWILINFVHLSYLGSFFDHDNNENGVYSYHYTLSKWNDLYFCSHIIVFVCFLLQLVLPSHQ